MDLAELLRAPQPDDAATVELLLNPTPDSAGAVTAMMETARAGPPRYDCFISTGVAPAFAFSAFRHRNAEGFRLLPTDMPSATAATAAGTGGAAAASKADPLGHDTSAEMLRARFCLAPSGTGFGMRAYHALILGLSLIHI